MGYTDKDLEKLQTTLAGVKVRTPVGVAAVNMPLGNKELVTPESHADVLLKHVEAGAGFICVPGCDYYPPEMIARLRKQSRTRDTSARVKGLRFMGDPGVMYHGSGGGAMQIEPEESTATFLDKVVKLIAILRKNKPENVPLIASTQPIGAFGESAVACAKKVEEQGVDIIELNLSCGGTAIVGGAVDYYLERDYPLLRVGLLMAEHIDLAQNIVREVVKAVHVPVGVKLSPEMGFPRVVAIARAFRDAGAKYVQSFNNAVAIAPPDIYNGGRPVWPFMDANPFVEAHGSSYKAHCYKHVAGMAKFAPGLDIIATGGLERPEDVVEVMMLGANVAAHVTGILYYGRNLLRREIAFLLRYMDEQGYKSVQDFHGLGLKYIRPAETVDFSAGQVVAAVDPTKCQACGHCVDHICLASYMENGRGAVRAEMCQGCGVCATTCPHQARRLVARAM